MFQNQTKQSWQIQSELRLNRLESDTLAVRKKCDAIYEGELQTLQKRRTDLERQIQSLTAPNRDKRVDNTARLANIQTELAAVNTAYAAAQERYSAAQVAANDAINLLDRARTAWRKLAGGMSLGFDMLKV